MHLGGFRGKMEYFLRILYTFLIYIPETIGVENPWLYILIMLTEGFLLGWGIEFLLRKWKWFGLR